MPNASIGGLVSGLDTASIISQLMQLEAVPQNRLKSRVTNEQSAVTALQGLNTKLAGIAAKAGELSKATAWSPVNATSSNEHVTAKAESGAAAASLTFTVNQLATRSQSSYVTTGTRSEAVTTAGADFRIDYADGRDPVTINTGSGSLQDVADALNANGTGLSAALVRTGTNPSGEATYRLSVSSKETGAASGFTVVDPSDPGNPAAFMGGVASAAAGQDASITVTGEATPLTSASNTFEDLMPGVDVTLGAKATGSVTIDVQRDSATLADKVKAMVDAVNSAVADIDKLSAIGVAGSKGGVLAGNSTLRTIRDQLLTSVSGGVDGQSLAPAGIEVDRYGKVTFDTEKFTAAYAADPTATTDLFVSNGPDDRGFATGLEALSKRFSDSRDGVVTSLVTGRNSAIKELESAIASWDVRLTQRRSMLERQYGALEVALGKLQSQSTWLAGQINSLPTTNQS